MPAARTGWAVLAVRRFAVMGPAVIGLAVVVILLSACSIGSDSGSGHHSQAWYRGYVAGKEARREHRFKRNADFYDRMAFCAETAFNDIQKINHNVVQWTEGFHRGCYFLPAPG